MKRVSGLNALESSLYRELTGDMRASWIRRLWEAIKADWKAGDNRNPWLP